MIVTKQYDEHIATHQQIGVRQHDRAAATEAPGELIIDADQIEFSAAPAYLSVLLPQKLHPVLREELGGIFLCVRINLMDSVAAPDAQRGFEAGQLSDASFEWIIPAGAEVSR